MKSHTEGIRPTEPVKWRSLDGVMGVYWTAEAQNGAAGRYVSPDPRIMIFLNDVSPHIRVLDAAAPARPMARAIYVPAGMPLETSFTSAHRFSHLDLHLHEDRLLRLLSPSIGRSAALSAVRRPVETQDVGAIETLARLLVDELSVPARPAIYAESLAGCISTALLDIPQGESERAAGRLTQAKMNRLVARLEAQSDRRLTVAEMAATVGLSESWFAHVFKRTTGKTPLQWQLGNRIELAKRLLEEGELPMAGIAAQLGFADQAHFTKAFRQVAGETPAAWRRMRRAGE